MKAVILTEWAGARFSGGPLAGLMAMIECSLDRQIGPQGRL